MMLSWRPLRCIASWGGVALGLLLLVWLVSGWHYERQFEARVDALRASGAIVDPVELNQPAVPDEENAALLLLEARDWREEQGLDTCSASDALEFHEEAFDDEERAEQWASVVKWIDAQAPFFERVERALRRPRCNFGVDYRQGWEARVEAIPVAAAITEAFSWRVRVAEHRNQPAMESLADCVTVLQANRRIDRGFLITYLVMESVDSAACEMIRRVAGMRGFDAARARALLDPRLITAEDEDAFRAVLEGERAVLINGVRRIATWRGLQDVQWLAITETKVPTLFRIAMTALRPLLWKDGERTLRMLEEGRRIIDTGGTAAFADLNALVEKYDGAPDGDGEPPMWRFLSTGYRHIPLRAYKSRLSHLANLRVARIGLACLEHRQRHGEWPRDSSGILDPFTGEPFVLAPEGDSVRIEASVPWLDEFEGTFREERRIYWTLTPPPPQK